MLLLLLMLCSVEELLNLVIPVKSSTDLDMDPCKSDRFDGRNLESQEYLKQNLCKSLRVNRTHLKHSFILLKLDGIKAEIDKHLQNF
jgi:hypothetical protein